MVSNTIPPPDPTLPSRFDTEDFLVVFAQGIDPPNPALAWGSINTQSDGWLKFWRADSPDSVVYPPSSILFVDHRSRPPVVADDGVPVGEWFDPIEYRWWAKRHDGLVLWLGVRLAAEDCTNAERENHREAPHTLTRGLPR